MTISQDSYYCLSGLLPFGDTSQDGLQRFLLLKYGQNDYTRNGQRGQFAFTEADADAILKDFASRGRDLVVDYEHATLTGQQAPASGWIERLEKGDGGLYAFCRWTKKAAEMLESREYRYFSPVILFGKTGRPCQLHSVAMTNHPALHGYPPLAATDAGAPPEPNTQTPNQREHNMNEHLKKLLQVMGMPVVTLADGGEDEAASAEGAAKAISDFLDKSACQSFADVTAKLKAAEEKAAQLEAKAAEAEADRAVEQAFADKKIAEGQRAWAKDYALKDPAGFKAFCDAASAIVPGPAAIVPGQKPSVKPAAFSDADQAILARCGVTKEDIQNIQK